MSRRSTTRLPGLIAAGLAVALACPRHALGGDADEPSHRAGILTLDMGGSMPGRLEGLGNDVVWRHDMCPKLLPLPRMNVASIRFRPTRKPKVAPLSVILRSEEVVPAQSLDSLGERSVEIATSWGHMSLPRTAVLRIQQNREARAVELATPWRFWVDSPGMFDWVSALDDPRSAWAVTSDSVLPLVPGAGAARDVGEAPDILTVTFDAAWAGAPVFSVLLLPPPDEEAPSGLGAGYELAVKMGAAELLRGEKSLAVGALPAEEMLASRARFTITIDRRARRLVAFVGDRRVVSWEETGEWVATGAALGFTTRAGNIAISGVRLSAGPPPALFAAAPRDREKDRLALFSGAMLTGTELSAAAGKVQLKSPALGLVSFSMADAACLTIGRPPEDEEDMDDLSAAETVVRLTDGGSLRVDVERVQDESLVCRHPILGQLDLRLDDVDAIIMRPDAAGEAVGAPAGNGFMDAAGVGL